MNPLRILVALSLLVIPTVAQVSNAKYIWGRPISPAAPADGNAVVWSSSQGKFIFAAGGGASGPTGPTGPSGPTGPTGATGAAGSSGSGVSYCAPASASATTYTCTPSPALSAYAAGTTLAFVADVAGTGGATTVAVSGLLNKSIKQVDGTTNPNSTDLLAGQLVILTYDGTQFRLPGPPTINSTGNASSAITAQNYFEFPISGGGNLNGSLRYSGLGVREATQFTFSTGIVGLNITAAGTGFTGGPFALSFASCASCAGTYTISGGGVNSYTITNFGTGVITSPTVTFPSGGGTGATATVLQIISLNFCAGRPGSSTHCEMLPSFALASASAPESGTFIVPAPPLYVAASTYTLVGTLVPTCTGGYIGTNCWVGSGSVSFLTAGSVSVDLGILKTNH